MQRCKLPALGPQSRAQANHLIEVLKKRVAAEMKKHVARHQYEASDVPF